MDRVINILKPANMTSHDVVARLRRLTKIKKIGHTGTLDPMATGVLPVCIGKATKIIEYFENDYKSYRCEMTLGSATDTQDSYGKILMESDEEVTEESIISAVKSFEGEILQIPPMYSALKVKGKKLYDLARNGEVVERKPRKKIIKNIDILNINMVQKKVLFDITCSKGTYVRTICHDIGNKLGTFAHMSFLIRTSSGNFKLADSVSLESLTCLEDVFLNSVAVEDVLGEFPIINLPEKLKKLVINGTKLDFSEYAFIDSQFYRVYISDIFLGIAKKDVSGIYLDKYLYKNDD